MASDKIGIYVIINKVNGKKYVGSSKNVRKRRNRHFSELRRNTHKNRKLQNSFNKYGEDNFEFKLLEEVTDKNELIIREQFFIDKLKPKLNINLIANSSLGVKRSEETKEKIRQANLGLKHPEWRNKIKSLAQGGDNHWTKTKSFSDESKEKMSNTHKQLYENGYKNPNSKTIYQYSLDGELIKEWESCYEAARFYECSEMNIRNVVKGRSKSAKGFIWKGEK